jgi:phospholipase A1/A2
MARSIAAAALSLLAATPALAAADVTAMAIAIEVGEGDRAEAQVVLLNRSAEAQPVPGELAAELRWAGRRVSVVLQLPPYVKPAPIAPGSFRQLGYGFALPPGAAGAEALLAIGGEGGYAFRLNPAAPVLAAAEPVAAPAALPAEAPAAKPDSGNAFLDNLSAYQPIYAVYGPGTASDARLQISFKYQLFGDPGAIGPGQPLANGLHFAFTQRMFWNLGKESSPFRSVDFMPEIFYLAPATPVGERLFLGGQAGFRHESNGRDGLDSRSLNTVYIQPAASWLLGEYRLTLAPRAWLYAGSLEDNPDIKRYRGNTGLLAEIGEDDGLRLTSTSRFNFGSGKGSIDAELSYPLDRIVETPLNLYVFGQAFAGYGENLFDYRRKATRLRVGIGIVR